MKIKTLFFITISSLFASAQAILTSCPQTSMMVLGSFGNITATTPEGIIWSGQDISNVQPSKLTPLGVAFQSTTDKNTGGTNVQCVYSAIGNGYSVDLKTQNTYTVFNDSGFWQKSWNKYINTYQYTCIFSETEPCQFSLRNN